MDKPITINTKLCSICKEKNAVFYFGMFIHCNNCGAEGHTEKEKIVSVLRKNKIKYKHLAEELKINTESVKRYIHSFDLGTTQENKRLSNFHRVIRKML